MVVIENRPARVMRHGRYSCYTVLPVTWLRLHKITAGDSVISKIEENGNLTICPLNEAAP